MSERENKSKNKEFFLTQGRSEKECGKKKVGIPVVGFDPTTSVV